MARPVMLGNGQLTVGLDEHGLVHDFYYPYVGLDNLTTARSTHHKIGIWVDETFSWVNEDGWDINVDFSPDALVSDITMHSDEHGVTLHFKDFVDDKYNAFCRMLRIENLTDQKRDIRIFMHQVFEISRGGRADTALYVPEEHYVLDYKGRCALLISGQSSDGIGFDQFSIGNYGIEGKEGTFRDAEDGELSNNPVEHGGVDSVLRFFATLEPNDTSDIDYWVIAADSQFAAQKVHREFLRTGLSARLDSVLEYWDKWLAVADDQLNAIDQKYRTAVTKSLMVIKAHTDKRGGIIASCDSSIYNYGRDYYSYVWPRDGAYAIWPLIRLGYTHEPRRFFEFCRDIMTPEGYLMHKYQPDKAIGSTWHPLLHGNNSELAIQEDETASVVYMLGEYYNRTNDDAFVENLYTTFIKPAANFMSDYIDEETGLPHASYDLWEEKFLTSTYTTACTYEALLVAADFADKFEYPSDAAKWRETASTIQKNVEVFFENQRGAFRKGFLLQHDGSLSFDNTLDVSSLYGVMMFAGKDFGHERIIRTAEAVENILLDASPSGGSARYEYDNYFASNPQHMGNPWFVTTLWMAQYYLRTGKRDRALHYIDWALEKRLPSGVLSEQIHPENSGPVSVTPLVWSHAELINTVLDASKQPVEK